MERTTAGIAALIVLWSVSQAGSHEEAPETFEIHVPIDADGARAQGLVAGSAEDGEALDAVVRLVRWRLAVADVAAEVSLEDDEVLVTLPEDAKDDQATVSAVLGGLGGCEFFLQAQDDDVEDGLAAEYFHFLEWREANPDRPLLDYNADPERSEPRLAWLPTRWMDKEGPPILILLPTDATEAFSSNDFESVFRTEDASGYPAIGFTLLDERRDDFETFTETGTGRRMAIVLAGTVRSAPTLNGKISGSGIIEGHFSDDEIEEFLSLLGAEEHPEHEKH